MRPFSIFFCLVILTLRCTGQDQIFDLSKTRSLSFFGFTTKSKRTIEWSKELVLFVFLSPDCPLSRNYIPALNSIYKGYGDKLSIYGIIPGESYPSKEVKEFIDLFSISFPLLKDGKQKLTSYLGATTTPEVFLLKNDGALVYRGAIDDWAVALGKKKIKASKHYLEDAITHSLSNLPFFVKYVQPVGCRINEY